MFVELQRETIEREEVASSFAHTFEFSYDHPSIDASLQIIELRYLNIFLCQRKISIRATRQSSIGWIATM